MDRALARLVASGLASVEGDAMTLMDPTTAGVPRVEPDFDVLHARYAFWLQADPSEGEDEILYGELGYWQHWWNALREPGRVRTGRSSATRPRSHPVSGTRTASRFRRTDRECGVDRTSVLTECDNRIS